MNAFVGLSHLHVAVSADEGPKVIYCIFTRIDPRYLMKGVIFVWIVAYRCSLL